MITAQDEKLDVSKFVTRKILLPVISVPKLKPKQSPLFERA